MIDWERVRSLRDEVGAEAFDEVVALFLEEVEETLNKLSPSTSVSEMADALHFLKGSALSLGFSKFGGLCKSGNQSEPMPPQELETLLNTYYQSKAEFLAGLTERFTS